MSRHRQEKEASTRSNWLGVVGLLREPHAVDAGVDRCPAPTSGGTVLQQPPCKALQGAHVGGASKVCDLSLLVYLQLSEIPVGVHETTGMIMSASVCHSLAAIHIDLGDPLPLAAQAQRLAPYCLHSGLGGVGGLHAHDAAAILVDGH